MILPPFYDSNLALRRGAQIHRYSSSAAGIYAFSRIERTEKVEYIVALNNAEVGKRLCLRFSRQIWD